MDYTTFEKVIIKLQEVYNRDMAVYHATGGNLSLTNYNDAFHQIIHLLAEQTMTSAAWDTVTWWLYEDVVKEVYNVDGTLYKKLDTIQDLYDYIKEDIYEKPNTKTD